MEKLTITRPDYSVLRNGEKIGSIQPGPFGWMAVDIDGKSDHYYPCRTQREAAARVATLFDRRIESGTRVEYRTALGALRTGITNGKKVTYMDGDAYTVCADTVDTWTRPVLCIPAKDLTPIG